MGSVSGLPSAFRQGAFAVGSTRPKLSLSVRNVCSYWAPIFMLWTPFDVGQAGAGAGIGQPAILARCRGLQIGREIGERVIARIVVVLILPHPAAEREHAVGIENTSPDRRNIKRSDLRPLIRGAHRQTIGAEAAVVDRRGRSRPSRSGRRRNSASGTRSG